MAVQFNTFAALLLAFPFYLAQKGKLAKYIDLAKPGQNSATVQNSGAAALNSGAGSPSAIGPAATAPNNMLPVPYQNYTSQSSLGMSDLVDMGNLSTVMSDAAQLFG